MDGSVGGTPDTCVDDDDCARESSVRGDLAAVVYFSNSVDSIATFYNRGGGWKMKVSIPVLMEKYHIVASIINFLAKSICSLYIQIPCFTPCTSVCTVLTQ